MTEKVLLNSGYKYYPDEHYKRCDKFYSKTISKEPTKAIRVLYYDKFKDDGALDYDFEYEYIEERNNYWYKTYIWGLNKDIPYTIEEIESILINGDSDEQKIKETTKLLKYNGLAETTIVKEEYYSKEEINKIAGKISDGIQEYINKYRDRPLMIMVSKQLEIFMINKIDIMHYRQMINIGSEPIVVSFIFGIPVLTTPVLDGLEFEIF